MDRLRGKVAFITGAASGQGAATALLFMQEGAKVVLADLDETGMRAVTEGWNTDDFRAVRCDVRVSEQVKAGIDTALDAFGKLDILCNVAGFEGKQYDFAQTPEEELDDQFAVNLKGVIFGMQHAIPHMQEKGGGSIINVGSLAGLLSFALAPYALVKAGVFQVTKAAAGTYGPDNIRINAIAPGFIDTPMWRRVKAGFADAPSEAQRNPASTKPLRREGTAREIATVALFFASDDSSYVTGTVLAVDGGWAAAAT